MLKRHPSKRIKYAEVPRQQASTRKNAPTTIPISIPLRGGSKKMRAATPRKIQPFTRRNFLAVPLLENPFNKEPEPKTNKGIL
jgi:hypothetical protein